MSILFANKSKGGYLTFFSGVKCIFCVWRYVTYVTIFKAFNLLLNSLNDTLKGILFHFRTDFCFK